MANQFGLAAGAFAAAAAIAVPATLSADEYSDAYQKQYVIDLGVGLKYKPKYPGADDYIFVPYPLAAVSRFYIPGIGTVGGGGSKSGFSLFPSFGFIGERDPSDAPILFGTKKVDWTVEAGLGVAYRYDWLRGFVAVRQGFNGHSGQVIDIGADIITQPTERIGFTFGPRVTWASDDYMSTYFGVTPGEAAGNPLLTPYSADAGFKTAGAIARVSYALTEKTTFHVQGGWERFIGDAEGSPIVKQGDEDQFWVGAGLSYRFEFNLFK